MAAVVITAKIFMQKLWLTKAGWDQDLNAKLKEEWLNIFQLLKFIKEIGVPRNVLPMWQTTKLEIYGFCDVSESAYGACVYIRAVGHSPEHISSRFLCFKSRVAPLKQLSIPRLELLGALLLSRLIEKVRGAVDLTIDQVFKWTDSKIVLAWLNESPTKWKTFVANRVAEIQGLSTGVKWGHVPSSDNPADLVSRGVQEVTDLTVKWWNGPEWLVKVEDYWPSNENTCNKVPEAKLVAAVTLINPSCNILNKYSSWGKLIRVIPYCLRFIVNCRNKQKISVKEISTNCKIGPLSHKELEKARLSSLRMVQDEHFSRELMRLRKGQSITTSTLSSLNPILDSTGLIRVGGRLRNADLSFEVKHPIILPSSHHVTNIIIREQHENLLHGGVHSMLYQLRQVYWILHGQSTVKRVLRDCIVCRGYRKRPLMQQMGNLPEVRLRPAKSFAYSGVDYGGPFQIKQGLLRKSATTKGYIALFICLVTKAVHLELVSDLRMVTYLSTLKRFMSRRGLWVKILSDNATTFVGMDNDFKKLWSDTKHKEAFQQYSASRGIEFSFIPPLAPHQGGIWEAGIKSVKSHLKRVLGDTLLTYEEFTTILCQVEACLNSRPLTPMSDDPRDLEPLTPAHFLIGAPIFAIPQEELNEPPRSHLNRWRLVQYFTQQVRKRGKEEYLNTRQQRQKWKTSSPNLQTGTLVLLKDSSGIPASWLLGRVKEVYTGKDDLVRSAKMHTPVEGT